MISIHAPLTRCDPGGWIPAIPLRHFNPRTSHEVRLALIASPALTLTFQSTHLSRGATTCHQLWHCASRYFNPRTSHEVRRYFLTVCILSRGFQSTHLSRGATMRCICSTNNLQISIHAPLTRCDMLSRRGFPVSMNFNPRTSHEVRRHFAAPNGFVLRISIHAPLTRCDDQFNTYGVVFLISIHAPLTRCDIVPSKITVSVWNFNPRTSHEVRQRLNSCMRF